MNADRLLAEYARIADAPDAIARLRSFVRELAVRGKLVPQDPRDEPTSRVLNRCRIDAASERPFDVPAAWAWVRVANAERPEIASKMLDQLRAIKSRANKLRHIKSRAAKETSGQIYIEKFVYKQFFYEPVYLYYGCDYEQFYTWKALRASARVVPERASTLMNAIERKKA